MAQLLLWGVFSLILSSTPVSYQNDTRTSEFFNLKSSAVDFSNVTVISDGFGGVYWNDDDSYTPAVAVDSSNTVHAVWGDLTDGPWGTDIEIMYANYTTATGWSNATVISDGFGGVYWNDDSSSNPAVAVDSSSAVHVVWYDDTNGSWGTDKEIMYANYTISTGWSNATVISDGFGGVYWNDGNSYNPAVAVDSSNTVHVVWYDFTGGVWGTDSEIMYANYNIATGWSNATVISDGYGGVYWNDGSSVQPTVAVNSSNSVHVVWYDYTDGPWGTGLDSEIMYANYTSATGWSNATVISAGFGGVYWNDDFSLYPVVAVDSSNAVHVVWFDHTDGPWGTDIEIMHANYTTASGWSNASVISDGFGGVYWNDGSSYNPAITVDSNNAVHVVWYDYTVGKWGTDTEIMYAYYTTASGWSNATVISDGFGGVYWNDGDSIKPTIVVDSNGIVHAVWYDYTDGIWGTDIEIMYAYYTTASGWSNATVISDGHNDIYWNDGSSYYPEIAVDNNNALHVVWYDSTDGIWGTDFEIMHANYTTASGWSNASVISDGFGGVHWNDGSSSNPAITAGTDKVYIIWYDKTDGVWGTDSEIMFTSISIPAPPITTSGAIPGYDIFIVLFAVSAVTYLFIRRKQKKIK